MIDPTTIDFNSFSPAPYTYNEEGNTTFASTILIVAGVATISLALYLLYQNKYKLPFYAERDKNI